MREYFQAPAQLPYRAAMKQIIATFFCQTTDIGAVLVEQLELFQSKSDSIYLCFDKELLTVRSNDIDSLVLYFINKNVSRNSSRRVQKLQYEPPFMPVFFWGGGVYIARKVKQILLKFRSNDYMRVSFLEP